MEQSTGRAGPSSGHSSNKPDHRSYNPTHGTPGKCFVFSSNSSIWKSLHFLETSSKDSFNLVTYSSIMNYKNSGDTNGKGNSSNPRPGQNPFPHESVSSRQTYTSPQEERPYDSSYSNNFDRESARFSTGRATGGSQYRSDSTAYPQPLRLPAPRAPPEQKKDWEESIYGMYGDVKTPKDTLPRQKSQRQQRRPARQPEGEYSADEEVPRRPEQEPERPRFERQQSKSGSGPHRFSSQRDQRDRRRSPRDDRRDDEREQRRNDNKTRQKDEENGNSGYRHVNINIDVGGGGSSRTYDSESGSFGRTNINIGTPLGDGGFSLGGRNNNGGGRLPVKMPFNLPINLPFGL